MTLLDHVKQALATVGIQPERGLLAVALSGGADSVCLLLALKELGFRVHALHCNFELRATESDADEAFCRRLCRQHEIPVSVRHFRTRSYAQRHGISIEMAARDLRYGWFAEQLSALDAVALCVAHHRDDNLETMLLNLIRGTGIHGLTGMSVNAPLPVPNRSEQDEPLQLLRPLLAVSRADIEAWLAEHEQAFVTDSTNLDADAAQRNTVRLRLLPLMEELNPRVRTNLAATIDRLADAEALYDDAVARQRAEIESDEGIDIEALRRAISPQTILFEILRERGFSAEQAADVYHHLNGESGHEWKSKHWRLLRDRGRLLWQAVPDVSTFRETTLPLSGLFEAPDGTRLLIRRQAIDPATFAIPRDARTACFDLEKLTFPLTIRMARSADRFQPFGMEGTRLVSDLLTDHKLSLFEKERQLVVCASDAIAWVVGIRVAAGFEVDSSTRHVMTITLL